MVNITSVKNDPMAYQYHPRDISGRAFNARVLQEARDPSVPTERKLRFLSIFSSNLDEFFRVRVAGLKRAAAFKEKTTQKSFYEAPAAILKKINSLVLKQQKTFDKTWRKVRAEMAEQNIHLVEAKELTVDQKNQIEEIYREKIEPHVIPVILAKDKPLPKLRDRVLYLGVTLRTNKDNGFAILEVPAEKAGRFHILKNDVRTDLILLEEIIISMLPDIFRHLPYETFSAASFKITRDAELDLDNDITISLAEKIRKGIKKRGDGRPTRLSYDRKMNTELLQLLVEKLKLTSEDSKVPGGSIHNFKDFMKFPAVFSAEHAIHKKDPLLLPSLKSPISKTILQRDLLLSFPYQSFRPVIDLLREAATDPEVTAIKITAYRLSAQSHIISALIAAARNRKKVTAVLELRARFDEENNLHWKNILEKAGVTVLTGPDDKKVHAKLCLITKQTDKKTVQYGFASTGNFNEDTAQLYGDHLLMTAHQGIMADMEVIFTALEKPDKNLNVMLKKCGLLLVAPVSLRSSLEKLIDFEIEEAGKGNKAHIIIKCNSLSDRKLIDKLYQAAQAGVQIQLIVRGIYCASNRVNFKKKIEAISIVDEILEHSRILYFYHKGKEQMYLSSADWMPRNMDHRVEAAVPVLDKKIKKELKAQLQLQLQDNMKARLLDKKMRNPYVRNDLPPFRSQHEIYQHLKMQGDKNKR